MNLEDQLMIHLEILGPPRPPTGASATFISTAAEEEQARHFLIRPQPSAIVALAQTSEGGARGSAGRSRLAIAGRSGAARCRARRERGQEGEQCPVAL